MDLKAKYDIKYLGPVTSFLGLKIREDLQSHTLCFNQLGYIEDLITRANMNDAVPLSVPMNPTVMTQTI
jgi:hypothetical protein